MPEPSDYLTGRVELLTLWPFAMAELVPGAPSRSSGARRRLAVAPIEILWR